MCTSICQSEVRGKWVRLAVVLAIGLASIKAVTAIRHEPPRSSASPRRLVLTSTSSGRNFPLSTTEVESLAQRCTLNWPASTSELMHFWRFAVVANDHEKDGEPVPLATGRQITLEQVASVFLDQERFSRAFPAEPAWLSNSPFGLIVRQKQGDRLSAGEVHPDEFLATLAECSVSLNEPVCMHNSHRRVRDILAQSQHDYVQSAPGEFSAVAFACYLAPAKGFQNKYGDVIMFDGLVESLTDEPIGDGLCGGTHVCYALAVMLNVNERARILSASAELRAKRYLAHVADRLDAAQHPDGAWRIDWSTGVVCTPPSLGTPTWGDAIALTGHHLEWLAIGPPHRLDSKRIERAISFLAQTLNEASDVEIARSYLAWSHAMRAILLWQASYDIQPESTVVSQRNTSLRFWTTRSSGGR